MSIPVHGNNQPSDATLVAEGYSKYNTVQFYVDMIGTPDPAMVAVYRWWNASDKDWVDITDGSSSDAALAAEGYTAKTFQYYAYRTPAAGRVAVYRWWQPSDRDWVTLRDGEIPDSTMQAWGYVNKNLLVYAYAQQSPTGRLGYFALGTPQSAVLPTNLVTPDSVQYPHTMSVLDVNPAHDPAINKGYQYLGHYGMDGCGGIFVARSNDLDAATWQQDPDAPTFSTAEPPCRWASTLIDNGHIALVMDQNWGGTLTGQVSTDGLNGKAFGQPTVLVDEPGMRNGNPTLFRDPTTNMFHLYWYRENTAITPMTWEIRVKSSSTFAGLVGAGPTDIGTLVAESPDRFAAPQVMYVNGVYYLAVETYEGDPSGVQHWGTRVLTGTSPTGLFYEIPGNPVYGEGAACVFQYVVDNTLHAFYCQVNIPGDYTSWTLDHVRGDLTNPT